MNTTTTIAFLNRLHFMPSWNFDAFVLGEDVYLSVTWDTVNSNREQAVKGYPQLVTLERAALIHPSAYTTEDELSAAVFTWLMEIMVHEGREFLRVGDDMRAPFHPHRPEGKRNWEILVLSDDPEHNPGRGIASLGL